MDALLKYFAPNEVREITGLGRSTVYAMFHDATFPVVHIGRRLLVRDDLLDSWLETQSKKQRETV